MMNRKAKSEIRSKAKLAYGLLNILKYDIDNLRIDVNECDVDSLTRTIQDTTKTLENLIEVISEIEYVLFVYGMKES